MRAGLIINLNSGKPRRDLDRRLSEIESTYNIPVYRTANPEDAGTALKDCATKNIDTLILLGGDGTIITALEIIRTQKLFNSHPRFLLFAAGTTNMIHRDVGHPLDSLEESLATFFAGKASIQKRCPLKVTSGHSTQSIHYGFFLATGAMPRCIRHIKNTYHKAGLYGKFGETLAASHYIVRLLIGSVANHPILRPATPVISEDGQNWTEYPSIFIFFTTLEKMILGITLKKKDKSFIKAVLKWPYRKLLRDLAMLKNGGQTEGTAIETKEHTKGLFISGLTEWVMDGEIHPCARDETLHVEIDNAVSFVKVTPDG